MKRVAVVVSSFLVLGLVGGLGQPCPTTSANAQVSAAAGPGTPPAAQEPRAADTSSAVVDAAGPHLLLEEAHRQADRAWRAGDAAVLESLHAASIERGVEQQGGTQAHGWSCLTDLIALYRTTPATRAVAPESWARLHLALASEFARGSEYEGIRLVVDAAFSLDFEERKYEVLELHLHGARATMFCGELERSSAHCDQLESRLADRDYGTIQAEALGQLAEARYMLGHTAAARRLIASGIARHREKDLAPLSVWRTQGFLAGYEGRHSEAAIWFGKVLADATNGHDRAGALVNRGRERRLSSDLDGAMEDFDEALGIVQHGELHDIEAAAHDGRAKVLLAQGRSGAALAEIECCLAIQRQRELTDHLRDSLQTLAEVALARDDVDLARTALDDFRRLGEPRGASPRAIASYRSRFAEWADIAQAVTLAELASTPPDERATVIATGLMRADEWRARCITGRFEAAQLAQTGPLVPALSAALPSSHAFAYFTTTDERALVYVLTNSTVQLLDLGPRTTFEEAVRRYADACAGRLSPTAREFAAHGHAAYEHVLGPVRRALPGSVDSLVIVEVDSLAGLPLAALVPRAVPDAKSLADIPFLCEELIIASAPSAAAFLLLQSRPPRSSAGRALYLGDVTAPHERDRPILGHRIGDRVDTLARLEHSRKEVVEVAYASVPKAEREESDRLVRDLLDPDAQRHARFEAKTFDLLLGDHASSDVLRGDLMHYSEIHIACHAYADSNDPTLRGLVLAPVSSDDDGIVDLAELRVAQIDADIVVLSACQTAVGPVMPGDGAQSIGAALLEAGARAVVTSFWDVHDARTRDLMISLRWERIKGASVPQALQLAQQSALREGSRGLGAGTSNAPVAREHPRHPRNWAAFKCVGALR